MIVDGALMMQENNTETKIEEIKQRQFVIYAMLGTMKLSSHSMNADTLIQTASLSNACNTRSLSMLEELALERDLRSA